MNFQTKDSGKRRVMKTGSQRDDRTGKGRYDLLSPLAIHRLAQLYERGASKYLERNWELGQPLSVLVDSGLRHGFEYLGGMRDEDHASAVVWNWCAVIHTEEMIKRGLLPSELYDLPNYTGIKFNMPKIKKV